MKKNPFTEDMRVRVTPGMKKGFDLLARRLNKKDSEMAREAFHAYLQNDWCIDPATGNFVPSLLRKLPSSHPLYNSPEARVARGEPEE